MSQDHGADLAQRANPAADLHIHYHELTLVEQALRSAEQRLHAAHLQSGQQQRATQRAEELYREVLALRDQSRRVLADLGEMWVRQK